MNCPHCQRENPPSARFCAGCGARLRATCTPCGAELTPGAKFCPECGAPAAAAPAAYAQAGIRPARERTLRERIAAFQEALPARMRQQLSPGVEGETRIVTLLFPDEGRAISIEAATWYAMRDSDA